MEQKQYIVEKTIRTGVTYNSLDSAEKTAERLSLLGGESYTVYEAICKTKTIVTLISIG